VDVVRCLLDKATTLAEEPTANKRLKKAGKQLRLIAMKLNKALAKDRADANVVNELTALIGEAQNIIAGLIN
jgi:hypothetical protein